MITDDCQPDARTVSNVIDDQAGQNTTNDRLMSAMVNAWGQFIDHDMDLNQSGTEKNEQTRNSHEGLLLMALHQAQPQPVHLLPNTSDFMIMSGYFKFKKDSTQKNGLTKLVASFIDTSNQSTRISVNMADVGTVRLPQILSDLKQRSDALFDTAKYRVEYTGSSITFLEGSKFIVDGLKQSILWAFLLIALCMLYLFKSIRILFCSLIPNVIPLIVTAGIMGWIGIRLKPSTVLIFSVALGIAIDVTIRFLVNYKQELPHHNNDVIKTVSETIKHTGLSILYTSMVLIAGFVIFCFSGFGGTQALGWLTALTLLVATLTNLVLLPVILLINNKNSSAP